MRPGSQGGENVTNMQIERAEGLLLEVVERYAPTATTAAEVEALAAVVEALVSVARLP